MTYQRAFAAALAAVLLSGCKTPAARGDAARLLDDDGVASDPATAHIDLEAKAPHLSNAKLDVQSYAVELTIAAFDAGKVPAKLTLKTRLVGAARFVRLHTERSTTTIQSVKEGGAARPFEVVNGQAGQHGLSGHVLKIDLGTERPAGSEVTLDLAYEITVPAAATDRGLTLRKSFQGAPIIITRNWPYYARYWLPSNDHPADTATFAFKLHVPVDAVGAANGRLTAGTPKDGTGLRQDGLRTFEWEQPTPIPTYGVNVSVGVLDLVQERVCFGVDQVNDTEVPCDDAPRKIDVLYYIQKNHAQRAQFLQAAKKGAKSLVFFSSLLGLYPYEKLGFVTAPHPFNMEAVSLIVMVSPDATVHEVAHHWWGNTVYFEHWGDFWISEGFTTYFTGLYDEFASGTNTSCSSMAGRLNETPATDPLAIFNNTPYCKGAGALAALRRAAGELAGFAAGSVEDRKLFFELTKRLFERYRFKRLTTATLHTWLAEHLGAVIRDGGGSATDEAVQAKLDTWKAAWFHPPS